MNICIKHTCKATRRIAGSPGEFECSAIETNLQGVHCPRLACVCVYVHTIRLLVVCVTEYQRVGEIQEIQEASRLELDALMLEDGVLHAPD